MSFSASIPVANLDAANAALEAAGFGPGNFSVPVYGNLRATHATLHAWTDAAFLAAVEALPGVTVSSAGETPQERVENATAGQGQYAGDATPLEGTVSPGLHVDADGALWWVIQGYNTATFPDPTIIPALIRRARVPGETLPWVQPIDQFDAYLLADPFTGEAETVMHNDKTWRTNTDLNVWEPGVFGWDETDADGNVVTPGDPPPGDEPEWAVGQTYAIGDVVTYQGQRYECRQAHTSIVGWQPPNVPALWLAL